MCIDSTTMSNMRLPLNQAIEASQAPLAFGQERPFPAHWGTPPDIQTCDYVQFPAGFGSGSSTVKNWILKNLREDAPGLAKDFPVEWGAPPEIQTGDYVELPDGYGMGSSTLRNWILQKLNQ